MGHHRHSLTPISIQILVLNTKDNLSESPPGYRNMVPLKLYSDGRILEINTNEFNQSILDLCEKHRNQNRALAFAFLLYDFQNPQIFKILEDINYWNALNSISGKYLSIYYINSKERNFAEDLSMLNDYEKRGLYPLESNNLSSIFPMLKRYLSLEDHVKLPSILFFQVEGTLILDYFLVELYEQKLEEGFLELKDYIMSAVSRLKMVDYENYANYQPIFESLKNGVKSTKFRNKLFRNVQKFPIQLLIGWITGKV